LKEICQKKEKGVKASSIKKKAATQRPIAAWRRQRKKEAQVRSSKEGEVLVTVGKAGQLSLHGKTGR